jgi:hypothetical protein
MNDTELNQMLHSWKAEANLPSSFQRDVWQRIEAAASRPAPARWLERFLNWIARPLPATAACALALAIGITAGGMAGGPHGKAAAVAYADSINPLVKATSP